jgi:hypothetical protein
MWKDELVDVDQQLAKNVRLKPIGFFMVAGLDTLPQEDRVDFMRAGIKVLSKCDLGWQSCCILIAQNEPALRAMNDPTDVTLIRNLLVSFSSQDPLRKSLAASDKLAIKRIVESFSAMHLSHDPATAHELRSLASRL